MLFAYGTYVHRSAYYRAVKMYGMLQECERAGIIPGGPRTCISGHPTIMDAELTYVVAPGNILETLIESTSGMSPKGEREHMLPWDLQLNKNDGIVKTLTARPPRGEIDF